MRRRDDAAEIERHIAENGVTELPAAAAAILGESSPGWRRGVERVAEKRLIHSPRGTHKAATYNQAALADRLGARRIVVGHSVPKRKWSPQRWFVVCRFFDKVCIAVRRDRGDPKTLKGLHEWLAGKYGSIGARFTITDKPPPTEISWRATMRPLLDRQLAKQAKARP